MSCKILYFKFRAIFYPWETYYSKTVKKDIPKKEPNSRALKAEAFPTKPFLWNMSPKN